jgi:hypothetical protein
MAKGILALLGKPKGDDEEPADDDAPDDDALADELLAAIESKDKAGIVEAIRAIAQG